MRAEQEEEVHERGLLQIPPERSVGRKSEKGAGEVITVVGSFVMDNVATMKRFPEAGETVLGERLEVREGKE